MTLKIAKKAISLFLNNRIFKKERYSLIFLGGEPLLQFYLIKKIIRYVQEKYASKKFEFIIFSNGSLLNEEIRNFIKENNIKIRITCSLDNPEVWNKIEKLFTGYKFIAAGFVVSQDSVYGLYRLFLEIFYRGIRRFYFIPEVIYSKWNNNKLKYLSKELRKISIFFVKNKSKQRFFINCFSRNDKIFKNTSSVNEKNAKDICILEKIKKGDLVIMPNGDVFSCNIGSHAIDKNVYLKNRLGNLNKDISFPRMISKIKELYRKTSPMHKPCRTPELIRREEKLKKIFIKEINYVNKHLGINSYRRYS